MKFGFVHMLIGSAVIAGIRILIASYYPLLQNWKAIGILVVVLALICTMVSQEKYKKILYAITLGFIIANVIQICVDVIADPTSHNLAPFEIIFLALTAFAAALIGVCLGVAIKMIRYKGIGGMNTDDRR